MKGGLALEQVADEGGQAEDKPDHVGVWDANEEWLWSFATDQVAVIVWARLLHKL